LWIFEACWGVCKVLDWNLCFNVRFYESVIFNQMWVCMSICCFIVLFKLKFIPCLSSIWFFFFKYIHALYFIHFFVQMWSFFLWNFKLFSIIFSDPTMVATTMFSLDLFFLDFYLATKWFLYIYTYKLCCYFHPRNIFVKRQKMFNFPWLMLLWLIIPSHH